MKWINSIIKTFKDKDVPVGDKISLAALLAGLASAVTALVLAAISLSATIAVSYHTNRQVFKMIMLIIIGILVLLIGLWLVTILLRRTER